VTTLACPACDTPIPLQGVGEVECPGCAARFAVEDALGTTVTRLPDAGPAPRVPGARAGLVALAGAAALACAVTVAVIVARHYQPGEGGMRPTKLIPGPEPAPAAARQPAAAPAAPVTAPQSADPWPECAAVRAWFKENTPDPASVEVVAWQHRTDTGEGWATLIVKFRGTNQYGGKSVQRRAFHTRGGRVQYSEEQPPD
jgi:hypothetical protein